MSGLPVTKSFRYGECFQICPPSKSAAMPPAIMNDYPCILEFSFDAPTEKRPMHGGGFLPDWVVENDEAGKTAKELLLVLTVLTTNNFFQYSSRQAWFISFGEKSNVKTSSRSEWGQEGYICPEIDLDGDSFSPPTDLNIPLVDTNLYFNRYGRYIEQELDFPENIFEMLDKYQLLEQDPKDSFLSACTLFSHGLRLWSEHPSLSFTSMVSALETLIHHDNKNIKNEICKECGQERYRVVKKFRDFFLNYGSPTPEFKKYAIKIYKHRSKILHRGELFLGEVKPIGFGSLDGLDDVNMRRNIISTCRICMVNWLHAHAK